LLKGKAGEPITGLEGTMSFVAGQRSRSPLVTVGIATYNRHTYLAEAIASVLGQEGFDRFELIVVEDGTTNPAVREVVASFRDPRLRVVRHPRNAGIAAAYNTIVREARGELIGLLGDDDVAVPDRLARQVAVFKRHPSTAIVHGDATIVDGKGEEVGYWKTVDCSAGTVLPLLVRRHNFIVDPTRLVHRRVYAAVGLYDPRYRIAQDFHFWLRAARRFRFRRTPGGPVILLRRHGENLSDEGNRNLEAEEVERALEEVLRCTPLRELVPELDWDVLPPALAKQQALRSLAEAIAKRDPPLPRLAERLRRRAAALPSKPKRRRDRPRVLFTGYGFRESGGGTLLPRLIAKGLAARGVEVAFFAAAATPYDPSSPTYTLLEEEQDGVQLYAVANRPHALFDPQNPLRELEDPPITRHFQAVLDRFQPTVIHCHNLHNLGAALLAEAAARGIPTLFTPQNHWLICPSGYLLRPDGSICAGPGEGTRCSACVGGPEEDHTVRFATLRALLSSAVGVILAPSPSLRRTLIAAGYRPEQIDLLPPALPHLERLWRRLGRPRRRRPLPRGPLRVGFLGSVLPHKGPQLLVEAAQLLEQPIAVELHGEVPDRFGQRLLDLDKKEVVELCGAYAPTELERVLAGLDVAVFPSQVLEAAGLVVLEAKAAGLPVVAARLGGLADAVREGQDGLLFTPFDASSLAAALERLAGDAQLLRRLQEGIAPPPTFATYLDRLLAYYQDPRPHGVAEQDRSGELAVVVRGDHGVNTSLSLINGRLAAGLRGRVKRVDRAGNDLDPPLPHGQEVELRHQWPPAFGPAALGKLAVILPWEFGAVPRLWLEGIERSVDLLLTPSRYVQQMFVGAGLPAERVAVVPNGVDLDLFRPDGERLPLPLPEGVVRFLFVGGLIDRKGADLLFDVFTSTFAGRGDVALVVKGAGGQGVYKEPLRDRYAQWAAAGHLPRILLLEEDLPASKLAALYRSCDLLVHPYRGEGFAMPVLEALAAGKPVIVTAGGPTDEFVPTSCCWRIPSNRRTLPGETVGGLQTKGSPWWLEPDAAALARALEEALDPQERARRAERARAAAATLSWERVIAAYNARLSELVAAPPRRRTAPQRFDERLRVLATPAWLGKDRLGELLQEWARATEAGSGAVLLLLADPARSPHPEQLERHLLSFEIDFDGCADVAVVREPLSPDRDRHLLEGSDLYVPLHAAALPLASLAAELGKEVVEVGEGRVVEAVTSRLKFDVAGGFARGANV
jgi:glycosyltransferase involved in cell wall biosynthesis